jgi:hypothetical protein
MLFGEASLRSQPTFRNAKRAAIPVKELFGSASKVLGKTQHKQSYEDYTEPFSGFCQVFG